MKINCDKKSMWKLLNEELLKPNLFYVNEIAEELNIHIGTIRRWIEKKEVPPQYFNDLNKMLNYKYQLNVSEEQKFKIMDQFFTSDDEAKRLIELSLSFISKNWNIDLSKYTLIEPSAGNGSFYNNFPSKYKKVGLDINPQNNNIKKMNWFDYNPKSKKNIVIGNPPFGLRGQLALKFINHAAKFSDFICFILPPLFNSNGKGSPMLRINKNFYLAKEVKIQNNNFVYPSGKKIKVYSIFQIWSRIDSKKVKPIFPPSKKSKWIKVYALSNGKTSSSKRNVKMIDKCDFYLPSTTFKEIRGYLSFSSLPHARGYGIVIKKERAKILNLLKNKIKWKEKGFKSTNGANNLRTQNIIDAVERVV